MIGSLAKWGFTYGATSHIYNNKSRLDAFHNSHTRKDETFDNDIAEGQYNDLKAEFENQTDELEDEFLETGAPPSNEVEIFEKMLGTRRGHIRGIGRKPSTSATPSFVVIMSRIRHLHHLHRHKLRVCLETRVLNTNFYNFWLRKSLQIKATKMIRMTRTNDDMNFV